MFVLFLVIICVFFIFEDLVFDKIMVLLFGFELFNFMFNILISSCVRSDGDIKLMYYVVFLFKGCYC